ncbi:hypothetical protein L0Y34_01235 [Candidatus Parcubacteria bacterium]|nr:hypothetical protein [Candidatus Parcubacteria bacterium]
MKKKKTPARLFSLRVLVGTMFAEHGEPRDGVENIQSDGEKWFVTTLLTW